jgi:hypothetical protein
MLRLVDPHTLGDFRWIAFAKQQTAASVDHGTLFLEDPRMA